MIKEIKYVEGCHKCFAHHEKSTASLQVEQHWCSIDESISYKSMREAVWSNGFPKECPIKDGLLIKKIKDNQNSSPKQERPQRKPFFRKH